eukprot:356534-Chlamydomonas_euryale.AAC.17
MRQTTHTATRGCTGKGMRIAVCERGTAGEGGCGRGRRVFAFKSGFKPRIHSARIHSSRIHSARPTGWERSTPARYKRHDLCRSRRACTCPSLHPRSLMVARQAQSPRRCPGSCVGRACRRSAPQTLQVPLQLPAPRWQHTIVGPSGRAGEVMAWRGWGREVRCMGVWDGGSA